MLVHPQSVVHAIAELADGSLVMQAAMPDMRLPIQAALTYPERIPSLVEPVELAALGSLTFEPLDAERFPAVDLAYSAGRAGRTCPAVLNAANEEAVAAFLMGKVGFADISRVTAEVLGAHEPWDADSLEAVLEADAWARRSARREMETLPAAAPGA